MSIDKRPVDAIKHGNDKRVLIPTTELAGEEKMAAEQTDGKARYQAFRHDFDRGRDPELYWLGKYRNDDNATADAEIQIDTRSLYVHEDIQPERLINNLYRLREEHRDPSQLRLFSDEEFGKTAVEDELGRITDYYSHEEKWKNRLIQGDSLLVMNSLLQREGMAGKVQCVYIDPPYGIKFGSNWQMKLNDRNVKDNDESLSGEPEMIKAFRDTWELGIHSYLSYLRDRLVTARELLSQSGSCFVQISDENVHLVRCLMDEVFGSENFVSLITTKKSGGLSSDTIGNVADYIVWYAKEKSEMKIRQLYIPKTLTEGVGLRYNRVEEQNGFVRPIKESERLNPKNLPDGAKVFLGGPITSQDPPREPQPFTFKGKTYNPPKARHWSASYPDGMNKLASLGRIIETKDSINYKLYLQDFPVVNLTNMWDDTMGTAEQNKQYVVQTSTKPIQRCILLTTDPGDLVLDPTCGSGTTAFVSEMWGRRWITIDTSRIALNIAKKRLATAIFPYYELFDESSKNIKLGFLYKKIPHITMKSLVGEEPIAEEVLYDQPLEDKQRMRVSGPFTVETLQAYNVTSPYELDQQADEEEENRLFQERIFAHLQANGVRNGDRSQQAVFHGVEPVASPYLNAKGWYTDNEGRERLVYFMIGPKFGTVSRLAVNQAIKEFRSLGQADGASWLVLLGFSFEDSINEADYNLGTFTVSKVRMHDDLMQDGLLKKDRKAGSFITIGEPDIALVRDEYGRHCHVEIRGLDIYDPIKDDVKARSVADIAYWEMDDHYDGCQFVVTSMHFCGGDKKEFSAWRKGLDKMAKASAKAKKNAESTLRLELSDELWDTLYGYRSEPIPFEPGRKVCVRVISQFGEESSKVLTM